MQNKVIQSKKTVYRILEENKKMALVIDCTHETMPCWMLKTELEDMKPAELPLEERILSREEKQVMHQRFSMICPILPHIGKKKERSARIREAAEKYNVSVQTIRKYLIQYLVAQDIEALAPKERIYTERALTKDEKNIRWALNRYFYNMNKNSLKTAYRIMLKERYCNASGVLTESYPSFYQFRYYYRKTKNMQNFYISRNGKSNYQRNDRPCIGEGIQEFAPYIGVGMLDATVCDIYLINDSGELIGRPILTVCVDAHSSLCCGYMLSWEGGVYSLTGLLLNVLKDKKEHCKSFGILIDEADWPCYELPAEFITDMGAEYTSGTFEQVTELGVTLTNLPPYRPELKGPVEKFFDIVQNYYKPYLKGKGVVEKDFQERGVHDYRKDACLTLFEFERILIKCILFYNKERVCKTYPYSNEMIDEAIQPTANAIWNWKKEHDSWNLIPVSDTELVKCLFGEMPVISEIEKIIAEHDNLIHGYGIKFIADLLREKGEFSEVNDMNRKRPIEIGSGKSYIPDLVCIDENGHTDYIEYECVNHTQTAFNAKCNKMSKITNVLNFVVPNADSIAKIRNEISKWIENRGARSLSHITVRVTGACQLKDAEFNDNRTWKLVFKPGKRIEPFEN